jgi:hypothetical protein
MSTSLLSDLLKTSPTTLEDVTKAKSELAVDPFAEFFGVNSPEFPEEVTLESTEPVADEMELAFAEQSKTPISIPQHDDGLDDSEIELTSEHTQPMERVEKFAEEEEEEDNEVILVSKEEPTLESNEARIENTIISKEKAETEDMSEVEIDETTLPWNKKPFDAQYFNFGGRTVNSLIREGHTCFDDIKGFAYSDLLEIKGFGRNCLSELVEIIELENAHGWFVKRKRKGASVTKPVKVEETTDVVEETVEVASEPTPPPVVEETVEVASESTSRPRPRIPSRSGRLQSAPVETTESEPKQVASEPVKSLKMLVVGNATALNGTAQVVPFETIYAEGIRQICEASQSPSLAMIEYGKGWAAVASMVRQNGWPQNVDVLTISKSFLGRPEILMELRLLADVVIEG